MVTVLMALFMFADLNGEQRARQALDSAASAERDAEAAYSSGAVDTFRAALKNMADNIEKADEALNATGRKAGRHPKPYKYAEQKSHEILLRLEDLERTMDAADREIIEGPRSKVQQIHDAWFDGIMGGKK